MINHSEKYDETVQGRSFRIKTKPDKIKHNRITGLHLMIGLLLFMMGLVTWLVPLSVKTERFAFLDFVGIVYSIFGLLLIIIAIFFNKSVIQKPERNRLLRIVEMLLLVPILAYSLLQKWYLPFGYSMAALLTIILAFYWEKAAQDGRTIEISVKGIYIPRFLKRNLFLQWQEVNRVVLRHAVFTVDCYDNHLYQYDVQELMQGSDSLEIFDDFCRNMIKDHEGLKEEDW